jgi:hypothetical protein
MLPHSLLRVVARRHQSKISSTGGLSLLLVVEHSAYGCLPCGSAGVNNRQQPLLIPIAMHSSQAS